LPRRLAGHATSAATAEKRKTEYYNAAPNKVREIPSPAERDKERAAKLGKEVADLTYQSHSYSDWYGKVKVRYVDGSGKVRTRWTTVTIKHESEPSNSEIISALALSDVSARYDIEIVSVDITSVDHVSDHTVTR
jgi:hypothetical protein